MMDLDLDKIKVEPEEEEEEDYHEDSDEHEIKPDIVGAENKNSSEEESGSESEEEGEEVRDDNEDDYSPDEEEGTDDEESEESDASASSSSYSPPSSSKRRRGRQPTTGTSSTGRPRKGRSTSGTNSTNAGTRPGRKKKNTIILPTIRRRDKRCTCGRAFLTVIALNAHARFEKHKTLPIPVEKDPSPPDDQEGGAGKGIPCFPCKECRISFSLKKFLDSHLMTHQGPPEPVQCEVCGLSLPTKSHLNYHLRVNCRYIPNSKPLPPKDGEGNPKWKKDPKGGRYLRPCSLCGKEFSSRFFLEQHERRVHPEKVGVDSLTCQHCMIKFPTVTERDCHERSVHQGKNVFSCSHCPKVFPHKSRLDDHLYTGHKIGDGSGITKKKGGKMQCEKCGKALSLKSHKWRHQATCPGESDKVRRMMKERTRMMNPKKLWTCEVCGWQIEGWKYQLKKHKDNEGH